MKITCFYKSKAVQCNTKINISLDSEYLSLNLCFINLKKSNIHTNDHYS